jgi:phage terminase large subunit-like protein
MTTSPNRPDTDEPEPVPATLTPREADAAWRAIAHPAQLPPPGDWRTWLFQGGRGAGKTRAGAEWLASLIAVNPGGRFAMVGATIHDVREVMIEGPSGLRSLPHRPLARYEAARRRMLFANGAVLYAFSAAEPERLRGPQFHAAWADEFCAWPQPEETLALLRMGVRLGDAPQVVITTTPKPIKALRNLREEPSCVVTQAGTVANAAHLAPDFLDTLHALYGGSERATQEIDGVMIEASAGALWKAAALAAIHGPRPPELDYVVVAIDPPASSDGAECGIIVAGRRDRKGYVLADRSARGLSPLGWARRAAQAAEEFGATALIAEANQGGDMVRTTLQAADVQAPIRLVHAAHSKRARAEPVSALYDQGRIVHCAAFPQLEEQMMAFTEAGGFKDRVDALVWALTELLVDHRILSPSLRFID